MSIDAAPANQISVAEARERRRGLVAAFLLTWAGYATYYLGRKGFSVTKARIQDELHLSMETLGNIDTVYLIAYACGQFLCGNLGDRIGARRLVGGGLIASALLCLVFGQAATAGVLLVAFLANGLAQSSGWPGTIKAMAAWTEGRKDRGAVMGRWSTCYQIGGIAATALASYLLAFGWRQAFRVPAIAMASMGAIILLLLRERPGLHPMRAAAPPPGDSRERASTSALSSSASLLREDQLRLYRDPLLWSYSACYFTLKLIRYSLLFWLPYYLHTVLHFEVTHAGYLSIAFEVGGVAGSLTIGVVSDRFTRLSRPGWAALSVFCLGLALLAYSLLSPTGDNGNIALLALIGFLLFGPDSLISGAAAQDAGGPRAAATAAGMINGVGSVGAILQGTVTVEASKRLGWNGLFSIFVALAFLGSLLLIPAIVRTQAARRRAQAA